MNPQQSSQRSSCHLLEHSCLSACYLVRCSQQAVSYWSHRGRCEEGIRGPHVQAWILPPTSLWFKWVACPRGMLLPSFYTWWNWHKWGQWTVPTSKSQHGTDWKEWRPEATGSLLWGRKSITEKLTWISFSEITNCVIASPRSINTSVRGWPWHACDSSNPQIWGTILKLQKIHRPPGSHSWSSRHSWRQLCKYIL